MQLPQAPPVFPRRLHDDLAHRGQAAETKAILPVQRDAGGIVASVRRTGSAEGLTVAGVIGSCKKSSTMRVWYSGRASAFQADEEGFDSPYPLQLLTSTKERARIAQVSALKKVL